MDMKNLKQQLYAVANAIDAVPVVGKEARVKLTAGVDYLMGIANSIVIEPQETSTKEEKDVMSDEHDCAES